MTDLKFTIYTRDGIANKIPRGKSVMALGVFDGVHIAHRQLLLAAMGLGQRLSAENIGAWCFDVTPSGVVDGVDVPMLSTLEDKIHMMLSLGLDFVAVGDFQSFRHVGAEVFIESFLKEELGCIGVACGFNHRFGHQGLGKPQMLSLAFGDDAVEILPEVTHKGRTVSSSAIRTLISQGDVETACEMLSRAFSLRAPVVRGKRLGRQLGFPTANQYFPESCVIPAHGIYATRCITEDGDCYVGISNVGVRPTITDGSDDHRTNCETYIHGFSGDLYDKNLTVEFCKYLRGEQKFASVNDLKSQIEKDLQAALEYFGEA